ncbi:hypothetical protein [Rhodococcus chondri]|uniref:Uncharacterized protein n=1 Tax=Rhodococcus chondri TaxID=3065941 RepID=A0ABU7JRK2_9NOCA|nr:hypothetical protein [Rhodococcus sp. CC-R104]MEE2032455.1 hypothetical protein [Rhodococcus sp. CC-R104]
MSAVERAATEESFALLRREPFFDVVVDLVAGYLSSAFVDPAAGEVDRWTLACLPETGRTPDSERLFTLAVGPVEVLYVDRFVEGGETVDYRTVLTTSESALTHRTGRSRDELALSHPLLRFHAAEDASADGDGVVIDWFLSDEGADDQFFALPLDETTIGPLAARLASRGRGPYVQHNRWFAQYVLDAMNDEA